MRETAGRNAVQVKAVQEFATTHKADLRGIELDVASQESVDSAVRKTSKSIGRLDVIVHNAGHMVFGPPEQFAELYEVNVLSRQRVNCAALPKSLAVLAGIDWFLSLSPNVLPDCANSWAK